MRSVYAATSRYREGVLSSLLGLALAALPQVETPRPNIVLIYADDHAEAAISACGGTLNRTPNIDRLASQGMRFSQSFVANAICGPARATLLTGLHSHANGRVDNVSAFRDELPTWSKLMQAAGYQTAMFGKWHLPTDPNGFDTWAKTGGYYIKGVQTADGFVERPGYTVDVVTDLAIEWIEERDQDRPFVAWLSHNASHRTWMPSPDHLTMYDDQEIPEPISLFTDHAGKSPAAALTQMRIAQDLFPAYDLKLPVTGEQVLDPAANGRLAPMSAEVRAAWDAAYGPKNAAFAAAKLEGDALTRWKYQRYIKDYLRCVASLDDSVGRLMNYLDESGLAENTLVIYTADQGFFLGEHGWYDKRWMYEPALRTPMIMRWPGQIPAGAVDEHLVQNIDLAPTFLEVAGLDEVKEMHGLSLLGLMRGQTPQTWRDAIYYHYQEYNEGRISHRVAEHDGVRTDYDKLIRVYRHDAWEYYDLRSDPNELKNRIGDPRVADRVAALKQRLREFKVELGDSMGKPIPPEKAKK